VRDNKNVSENENDRVRHVAIVGGGIAGLSTAWYLQQKALDAGLAIEYTLLEQGDRWGGKIKTETVDGYGDQPFVVEAGPDSFISQKPWALQLARELGLEDQLLGTNDDRRKTYVLNNGRPTPLPDGVLLIVPTRIMPFALSPLISPVGKLRMGLDLFIPARRDGQDETLAEFITRRLGAEALDKIAEPLMSGIYNAEAEKQSLLATFPRFRILEEKHGSLIKGMLAGKKARSNGQGGHGPDQNKDRPKTSMFVSLKNGTGQLVEELSSRLTGRLRLNTAICGLMKLDGGYQLTTTRGDTINADAVVLAIPAYGAAKLIRDFAPEAAGGLYGIRYVSTGTVSLAYRSNDVNLLEGFGLVIPRSEGRLINAVTITSTKFDKRAPKDHVLLRIFFGGSRNPQMMDAGDEVLMSIVSNELEALLGIKAQPLFRRIYRWRQANPQYDVGHLDRLAEIEAELPGNLFLTGSPYRGIGLPDCVRQGQETAQKLIDRLVANCSPGLETPVGAGLDVPGKVTV